MAQATATSHGELTLRVITPDRIVLDKRVTSVRIPGVDGSIGILPRHAPMIAAIGVGLLHYTENGVHNVLFVSEGFAEVRDNTVRVVCEAGEVAHEIDEARAREAEKRARERLDARAKGTVAVEIDLIRAESALLRALMRLEAASHSKRDNQRH